MKHAMHKRMLCLALALALLAGLLPAGAVQANAQGAGVTFQDVPNTYEAADLILDSAHAPESEDAEQPLVTDENGKVRVSIVMAQESTLEKMDYQTTHLAQNAESDIGCQRHFCLGRPGRNGSHCKAPRRQAGGPRDPV